jgi:anti-sigma factor RsiW
MRNPDPKTGANLSELDIQAYVDGVLESRRAARVGCYLGAAPDEARRVAFYHRLNAQLRNGFPKLAQEPPFGRLEQMLQGATQRHWRVALMLCGTLVAAVALFAGWVLDDTSALTATGVMAFEEVATADAPCSTAGSQSRATARQYDPDLAQVGFRISACATLPIRFLLTAMETVYRNAAGQPVVLLRVADWGAADQPQWQAQRVGSIRVLSWKRDGAHYLLVGDAGTRGLMKAADLASSYRGEEVAQK